MSSANATSKIDSKHLSEADSDGAFLCNVCLEPVKDRDPVVTQCGHLYCWPCLFRWLNTQHTTCPVCKAGVTTENVIPIFIKGSLEDPRGRREASGDDEIPSRPLGRRPEPVVNNAATQGNNNNNNGNVTFTAGIGFFPSLFGLQFQSFVHIPPPVSTADHEEAAKSAYIQRILLIFGVLVMLCLLFF